MGPADSSVTTPALLLRLVLRAGELMIFLAYKNVITCTLTAAIIIVAFLTRDRFVNNSYTTMYPHPYSGK